PKTPHDVVAVLHHASEKGLNVQVWGGGTRSGFGSPPPADILVSTDRLADVEVYEPDDLTVVVGAGARVDQIGSMLAEHNQSAVLPEVPGSSTLGGVIAAGASGLRRGRLFGTRERLLETTVVTGDGRIVRGGGRVVKNVTGYDVPRLHFGAFGSLGIIVSVCLKLWPVPPAAATVRVDHPEAASSIARPLAILEENAGSRVFVWGTEAEVESKIRRLGGDSQPGHDWPSDPSGDFRWSLRLPPALTAEGIRRLPSDWRYLAVHGVGEIRAASGTIEGAADLRSWAETTGGHLVVAEAPSDSLDGFDPWGTPPPGLRLQSDLIAQFDPARVINPGRLPGGL
ncbi:MAG: FAD-binding protein, partial [Actinomycetota bacterium]|nr:FAD-binding protein [Actinomycetota bacterium]